MTERKLREQQAEDARDALTMHRLMEAEGQALLELMDRLEQDPAMAPPPELDARCMDAIRRISCRSRRRPVKRVAIAVFRYVAAAVLVTSLLFITAFAMVEQVREGTLKFLVEITDSHTKYTLIPREDVSSDDLPAQLPALDTDTLLGYRFPQAPQGFTLENLYKYPSLATVQYRHPDGAELELSVSYYLVGQSGFTTADGQVTDVNIDGYEGKLIRRTYLLEDGREVPWSRLVWGNTQEGVLVTLTGHRVEAETLLELGRGAQWVGFCESAAQPVLMGYQLPDPPEGFHLDAYGMIPSEQYAQYRQDNLHYIRIRVSDKPYPTNDYLKVGSGYRNSRSAIIANCKGQIINYSARKLVSSHVVEYHNTIILWSDPNGPEGQSRYLWIEGHEMTETILLALAERILPAKN